MKSQFLSEFNKQKTLTLVVFFIGITLLFTNEIKTAITYVVETRLHVWEISFYVIVFLFPLFCVVPCLYLFDEKESGFMRSSLLRTSIRGYFKTKFLYGSSISFLICFLISFLGAIFCFLIPEGLTFIDPSYYFDESTGVYRNADQFAYELFTENPIVYAVLLSIWRGIVGIVFYFFGVILVFLTKNKFLVVIIPFVYYHLENYFWAILDIYQTRTFYSVGLGSVGIDTSYFGFATLGPIILSCLLYFIYLIFIRKKIFRLIK